jgi:hypothetical protein
VENSFFHGVELEAWSEYAAGHIDDPSGRHQPIDRALTRYTW